MLSLYLIRSDNMVGSNPSLRSFETNLAPEGLTISPSSDRVVKQMFFAIIRDGYMDLKSSTTTQW